MEPKVQIVISEATESQQVGNISYNKVVNPVLVLQSPIMPTVLTFSITTLLASFDFQKVRNVEVQIVDEYGKEIIFSSGVAEIGRLPKEIVNLNFHVDMRNVLFKQEGIYYAKVYVDGRSFEQSFEVRKER